MKRWLESTLTEVFFAIEGHEKNWEWDAWIGRNIQFAIIQGNQFIKNEDKPKSVYELFRLSIDPSPEEIEQKKEVKRPSKEELQHAENILKGLRNGNFKQPDSKDKG